MKNALRKSIIVTLAIALLISGCSSTKSKDKSTSSKENTKSEEARESVAADNGNYYINEGLSFDATSDNYEDACYDIETPNANATNPDVDIPTGQMLIRNVSISADTADFPGLSALVDNVVKANGGYYESMSVSGTGEEHDYRHGYYVIRVPAENLDALIASLEGSFTITSRNESTEDVTLTYVDMESRLESLKIEMDDLLKMLEQAEDVDTIVYLQSEISSVRYQIESYESQIRVLSNQVNLSTLRLTLNEVVEEKEKEPIEVKRDKTLKDDLKEEWKDSIDDLKDDGKSFLLWVVGNAIYIAIFVVIAVVAIIITVSKVKKYKKSKKSETLEKAESDNKPETKDDTKE